MQLHQLQPEHPLQGKKTRVGRGGKRGTTAGRGTKGQKSRSGHRIRPAERDYLQRLPKKRGYKNPSLKEKLGLKPAIVNVGDLERLVSGNLIDVKVMPNTKILGDGELKKSYTVKGVPVSGSAKKKIEAAGGKVE
ncbi:MAG: uL15 family ribosomal protein [Patescibacteria group bacterium]